MCHVWLLLLRNRQTFSTPSLLRGSSAPGGWLSQTLRAPEYLNSTGSEMPHCSETNTRELRVTTAGLPGLTHQENILGKPKDRHVSSTQRGTLVQQHWDTSDKVGQSPSIWPCQQSQHEPILSAPSSRCNRSLCSGGVGTAGRKWGLSGSPPRQ